MSYNLPIVKLLKHCPLCDSDDNIPVRYERNTFSEDTYDDVSCFRNTWINLLKCNSCSFRFTKEIPVSPTFFQNRYDNNWFDPEAEISAVRKSEIVDIILSTIEKYNHNKGMYLDVGSFAGKLLVHAKERGYTPEGIEVNPKLAQYCNEKLGFKVHNAKFQEASLNENFYDAITIIDVLEHLEEPKKVLEVLYSALKPDGILYIKVPNGRMQMIKQNIANALKISSAGMFTNFGHINHFGVSSISRVLEQIGFQVVRIEMAQSEQWGPESRFYQFKNLVRNSYFYLSNICYRFLGLPIGFNLNVIVTKK